MPAESFVAIAKTAQHRFVTDLPVLDDSVLRQPLPPSSKEPQGTHLF
ncbi:MAG: hypothetical protein KME16_07710 [Scytolyngbya sp. HA4215-MV1]|nr:hypothetical protein [Scytolyngbya sp. HA4215-MV1]